MSGLRSSARRLVTITIVASAFLLAPASPAAAVMSGTPLAATGWDASTVIPWVIGAAIVVILGAVLLILARRRRSRDDR